MQSNSNFSNTSRNSYGFSIPQQFQKRNINNVSSSQVPQFISQLPPRPENNHPPIKSNDKAQNMDSPTRKKFMPVDISTVPTSSSAIDNKIKTQFLNNSENKSEEHTIDVNLRGSCSNVLRKCQQTNLTASLRNTTHFNPVNKFNVTTPNLKKQQNDAASFKTSFVCKTPTAESANFLKPSDKFKNCATNGSASSRTPIKSTAEKKLDQSANFSTTPLKYKPYDNMSKSSAIRKEVNTQQQKKPFKSLNQIVECKAREKLALQTSKGTSKKSKITNGFQLSKTLGKGKFGQVFLSRHHEAGFIVALKKVMKSKVTEFNMLEQFCKEIRLHSCLDHPNIVKFYGFFDDQSDIYLVLEYMNGGTLFDYLNQIGYLKPRQATEYLRDIIDALIYMHEKSIAHRDIKPENIVINSEGVAKLCDFGWSAVVQTSRRTYCGTFDYAPPQILQRKTYDTSVDVWCIGVLTYELMTGRAPFEGDQKTIIMQKILNVDKHKIDYPIQIPAQAKEFIQALVQKDPALRPKTCDLLKFKLFSLYPRVSNKSKK